MAFDFPYDILDATHHRPWAMPRGPWIMRQTWHDLLFAHWPVEVRALQEKLPSALPLDLYDGQAWIGVIPFHMSNVAPRGVPSIPFVSAFPELNVRTYVTRHGKPGVYFFSLDAGSAIAVRAARTLFHLPYHYASMTVEDVRGEIHYGSRRAAPTAQVAEFAAAYRPVGPVQPPRPGTLAHFLTERYCLYTVSDALRVRRLQIHHPPWPLQAADANITLNTMAEAAGIRLPSAAPLLHFSKRLDMVAWPMEAA